MIKEFPHGRVILGDCLEVMPTLEKVDLVLTDPPYGVNKADWDSYLPLDWYYFAKQLTKKVLLCVGNSNIPMVSKVFSNDYCQLIILKNKNGMQSTKYSFDNFIPCFQLGEWKYRQKQNVIDFVVKGEKPDHPSPKPYEAIEKLMLSFTDEDELILDPFAGSMTTAIACINTNRKFICIEKDETYFNKGIERIEKHYEKMGIFREAV